MLHICGKSNFNIPDVECDGSLHFEGVADTTINQGVGIDLAEGVSAYDSDGNEVEFTYKPEEIEKCDVGEHAVTYTAQGKNAGDMIPTVCGTDRLHLIDCGIDTVKATRIITITQAGDPVIQGIDPTLLPSGSTIDLLSGVTATDDNGNELEVTWYGEKDSLAEGDIATFETNLAPNLLKKAEVRLDPVQDLHGYDRPWVGGAGKNLLDLTNATLTYCVLTDADTGSVRLNVTNGYYANITQTPSQLDPKIMSAILNGDPITIEAQNVGAKLVSIIIFGTRSDSSTMQEANGSNGIATITPSLFQTVTSVVFRVARSGSSYTDTTTIISNIRVSLGSTTTAWSPYTNICPIYGHDDVEVWHTGVNVWDEEWEVGGFDSVGAPTPATDRIRSKNFAPIKPSTTYYCKSTNTLGLRFYDADKAFVVSANGTNVAITTPSNAYYLKVLILNTTTYGQDVSINYPATDTEYHPYQGTTYNQEIEVTYTPTSTNNIPYNFKAVGDIYGDRLRESIVGGTVAWSQLVQNGNFSNGTTGWNPQDSVVSVSGGVCTVTATARNHGIFTSTRLFANHKYLITCDYKMSVNTQVLTLWTASGTLFRTLPNSLIWATASYIFTAVADEQNGTINWVRDSAESNWQPFYLKNEMFFDLTQMFGSTIADYIYSLETANAGAGVAWFKKLFPKDYYAYNAGQLMSVNASAHNTVGFNQLNSESYIISGSSNYNRTIGTKLVGGGSAATVSGSNPISVDITSGWRGAVFISEPLVGGQQYQLTCSITAPTISDKRVSVLFIDEDDTVISNYNYSGNSSDTIATIIVPSRSGLRIGLVVESTTAQKLTVNNLCLHLVWDGERNGEYEPYVKHEYALDSDLELRGIPKLDSANNLYYDGDTYESDGAVNRRYGIIDLGTLTWTVVSGNNYANFYTSGLSSDIAYNASTPVIICSAYKGEANNTASASDDKYIWVNAQKTVRVKDTSKAGMTADDFKDAMSGVYLVYELATPTTETAEPFADPQIVSKYGTEEYVGSEIPVGHNTTYLTRDIYGGTLDLVSGVLTVDRVMVIKNTADMNNSEAYPGWKDTLWNELFGDGHNVAIESPLNIGSNYGVNTNPTEGQLWLQRGVYGKTQSEWIALAMDVQIIAPLETPRTYQLNRHQIETLVGENNMWDDGYMKVVYTETIQNNPVTFDVDGTYAITYEAEDECGNETRQTRLIFIRNENVYFLGLDHVTNTLGDAFDLTENVHAYDGQGNELEYTVTPEYNAFALGDRTYTYTANGYSEGRVITIVPPTTPIQTEDDEDIETDDGVVLETDALTPIPLTYASNKWTATIPINPLYTYTFRLEGLKAFAYIRVNVTGEGGNVATYDGIGTTDWNLTWTPSEHVESGQSWENARQATIEISQTDEPTAYVIVQ